MQQPQLPRVVVIYLNKNGRRVQSLVGKSHNYSINHENGITTYTYKERTPVRNLLQTNIGLPPSRVGKKIARGEVKWSRGISGDSILKRVERKALVGS
jgi:hypothetical protein